MRMIPARLRAAARLKDVIDEAVTRAVNYHNNMLRPHLKDQYGVSSLFWHDGTINCIQDNYVDVEWSEYARGCEVDRGEDHIPVEALCDDTYEEAIRKIVADKLEKREAELAEKEAKNLQTKRAQFEALKAELGEG